MKTNKIKILGTQIGTNTIHSNHEELILNADIIVAAKRILKRYETLNQQAKKIEINSNFAQAINELSTEKTKNILIIANGDPLYFGMGSSLLKYFSANELDFIPYPSALQYACSKIGISSAEIISVSLHGRSDWKKLSNAVLTNKPICVLCDNKNTAPEIAKFLIERGITYFDAHILTDLNMESEAYLCTTLDKLSLSHNEYKNTTLILTPNGEYKGVKFGLNDKLSIQNNLQTKKAIRAIIASELEINNSSTVWDIGAGSGSVSFEISTICQHGQVYAVETDSKRINDIYINRKILGAANVEILHANAPLGLDELPQPDAIFIGGGLNKQADLLDYCVKKIETGKNIVCSCVLLSSLNQIKNYCKLNDLQIKITSVNISETKELADDYYFIAQNPIFVVSIKK